LLNRSAAEMPGVSMLGLVKNGTVGVFARASSARSRDIYRRYATGLYLQAFLTPGDSALAEHVTREVLVDECALAPVAGQGDPGGLLSEMERGALGRVGTSSGAVVEDGSQVGGPAARGQ
jgi:hypothetical protein